MFKYEATRKHIRPQYTDKNSTQTLKEGLKEYYTVNPKVTQPDTMPSDFAKILLAHDVSHVILGCDTNMYDELKLLPLTFWTSDFNFCEYLKHRQHPAVDLMYRDMVKQHGILWLYGSILFVLPRLLPEIVVIWLKTRKFRNYYPFFDYQPWLERSLLDIRQEFGLLKFIK
ncbi:hypothetical protein [Mastigocoleus testarum]|uniref:Uncharacterized protein n=1 Tax=Mastigocoleus testarum BC008 TaxID=371196 RepID=A0A0V7ZYX2_9CYAN|nr:hypothetical protein [Mastigocoleus testarum]KST69639.1 hypothetical protein BC008_04865 [Mastigocoleus testarum BC008]